MDKKLFSRLTESMRQMNEIISGERAPSRETMVKAVKVKRIRQATGLSQAGFAKLISVKVGKLRNWEHGRSGPNLPGKTLLRAIEKDPVHVLKALSM